MQASIQATELTPGYRVTIFEGRKQVASAFIPTEFEVMGGVPVSTDQQIEAAYRAAKQYAAGFGCC